MFGRQWHECEGDRQPAPQWAEDLARRYLPPGWRIFWKVATKSRSGYQIPGGENVYGCCWITHRTVQIYGSHNNQTAEALFTVLHEIAHGRHPTPETYRGRQSYHGPGFAKAAADLYQQFSGMLEYVSRHSPYKAEREECAARAGIVLPVRARHGAAKAAMALAAKPPTRLVLPVPAQAIVTRAMSGQ